MLAPHSSTKTSRRGSIPASSSQNSRRCSWTSGRSCSAARGTFFLRGSPSLLQGARDGHEAARGAEPLAAFLERGIGLLSDQLAEPLQVLRREHGRVPSAVGPGLERAGAAVELQQPGDEGDADQEPLERSGGRSLRRAGPYRRSVVGDLGNRVSSVTSSPRSPFKSRAIRLFGAEFSLEPPA